MINKSFPHIPHCAYMSNIMLSTVLTPIIIIYFNNVQNNKLYSDTMFLISSQYQYIGILILNSALSLSYSMLPLRSTILSFNILIPYPLLLFLTLPIEL